MTRDVDERKKRKVLNRIRRAKAAAERAIETSGDAEAAEAARRELSDWEAEFVASVEQRLNEFGSAFADPEKGALDEPLSRLQEMKLKEIEKKAKGKAKAGFGARSSFRSNGSGFRARTPQRASGRDIHDDLPGDAAAPETPDPVETLRQSGAVRKGFTPHLVDTESQIVPQKSQAQEREPGAASASRSPFRVIEGGKA
ncbi:hypothetical protein [Marinicauda sp. Alg238-R41]|uniref:hypothetical protein n=1 Tax=Marinicauda sp. Alg238-R41 TaxID=2993447 RepID=UPI0022DF4EDB|nr:hypothetical protein [Marinicauda sp. Alg238-R41]